MAANAGSLTIDPRAAMPRELYVTLTVRPGLRWRLGWALMRLAGKLLGSEIKRVEPGPPTEGPPTLRWVVPFDESESLMSRVLGLEPVYNSDGSVVRRQPMTYPDHPDLFARFAESEIWETRPDGTPLTARVTVVFGKPTLTWAGA
jgi:hypothetical protein